MLSDGENKHGCGQAWPQFVSAAFSSLTTQTDRSMHVLGLVGRGVLRRSCCKTWYELSSGDTRPTTDRGSIRATGWHRRPLCAPIPGRGPHLAYGLSRLSPVRSWSPLRPLKYSCGPLVRNPDSAFHKTQQEKATKNQNLSQPWILCSTLYYDVCMVFLDGIVTK